MDNVIYWAKLLAIIAGMTSIIPLLTWGMSGSWKAGLYAWKRYAIAMAWLCIPVLVLAGLTSVIPH